MHCSRHRFLAVIVCALVAGFLVGPSSGQDLAAVDQSVGLRAAEREQLYDEIAAEVTLLEQQGNLLKKVVHVVKPTVVHLETVKLDTSQLSTDPREHRAVPTVEEAGSGVIVQLAGRHYVVTNRHVI